MRALRYTGLGQAEVAEVPDPRPAETEVLVQVEAAGICHTDLDILHGNYAATFPVTPGHEFAGTVIGTGQEVDRAWLGRRVAVDPLRSCGACRPCLHGRTNLCEHLRAYGAEIDGGLATHAAVEVSQLVDVGDLAADLAAMAEPLACAVNAARRSAITASDDVLVVGAGPIGLLILTAFGSRGASLSVAEPQDRRRDHAAGFGAAASYPSINAALQARAGAGFDVVVDVTGVPAVAQAGLGAVRRGGRLVLFGVCPPESTMTLDPHRVYADEITVLGSFSLNGTLADAVELLRTTRVPVRELVTHRIGLEELPAALSLVGTPDALKIQVALG